jgi:ParB/RepB/Spo0J family partition protein
MNFPPFPAEVPVGRLSVDPQNLRLFDLRNKEDWKLYESIRVCGVAEPIIVVNMADGTLRICSGHRRYFAALALHMQTVPCILGGKNIDPKDNLARQLKECNHPMKMEAWQRMRMLGEIATEENRNDTKAMKKSCCLVASGTGISARIILNIVRAYMRLNPKVIDLLGNNRLEASRISQKTLIRISREPSDRQVDLIAVALGLDTTKPTKTTAQP